MPQKKTKTPKIWSFWFAFSN